MTIRRKSLTYMALVAGVATLLIQGCATPVAPPKAEDIVYQRATERWKLLVARDLDKAYTYLAPSTRAVTPLDRYKAELSGPVTWISGTVISVKCEEEKCDARIRLEAKASMGPRIGANIPNIVTHFDEPWVKEDAQWWHFQKL